MRLTAFLSVLGLASVVSGRTFVVKNSCSFAVWPALFTSSGSAPSQATGWQALSGSQLSFNVPDGWSGRIWGRRECDFSGGSTLPSTCKTGGCNGGLLCQNTGQPPASLAEWTLNASGDSDFYDLSLVDGFDLPLSITNDASCPSPSCAANLNANCPDARLRVNGTTGTVGCLTACAANIDGNAANSPNCCSGSYATPQTCPASGVAFYNYFKSGCPQAYAYAYDESSGSALFTCSSTKAANYVLEFCPGGSNSSTTSASQIASSSGFSTVRSSSTTSVATGAAHRLRRPLRHH